MKLRVELLRLWAHTTLNTAWENSLRVYFSDMCALKAASSVVYFFGTIAFLMLQSRETAHAMGLMFESAPPVFWAGCMFYCWGLRFVGTVMNYHVGWCRLSVPILGIWVWSTAFLSSAFATYDEVDDPRGLYMLFLSAVIVEALILSRVFYDDHYAEWIAQYYPGKNKETA